MRQVEGDLTTATFQDADLPEPLLLPDIDEMPLMPGGWPRHGSSGIYGASAVAAAYCGFKEVPDHLRGHWQHGWNASYRLPAPPEMILATMPSPDGYYWVARKDEEECLRFAGFQRVKAIGLPVAYLPPRPIRRRPGSLLVMPAHSLQYTTSSWKFDEYADSIGAIRHEFSEVVVCVHPACWKHGYWVDAFRNRGFTLVEGASFKDGNALERIRYLLSSFEYMVTNSYGSQLAYAAYFGAKPSIYGPYAAYRDEDCKNDPLFRQNPGLLSAALESVSEEALRGQLPWLFCHPREAEANVEWGRFEVGEANKVSPRKLRSLFGWTLSDRAVRSLVAKTPRYVRIGAQVLSTRSSREQYFEKRRLRAMPRFQPTRTNLLGRSLEVRDAVSFLEAKANVFDRELYRFVTDRDVPRIIDCGAGIGLYALYFKRLFPKSEVIAFEPDPRVFEVLKRNCASWGADDVRIIPKAVWTCESTLAFPRDGNASGRIDETVKDAEVLRVPTCRLRDYLTEQVDLLRLDIEGAEVDVLLDCADLLGQVQNLAVDYHSLFNHPQRLDQLMELLTRAGFRMHFLAPGQSPSPLLYRTVLNGMDAQLRILAFRDSES
jgi:FkbM family methyltransferase